MASLSSNDRRRISEEKARDWLNSIDPENLDDLESVLESIAESSIIDSSDSESGEEHALGTRTNNKSTKLTDHLSDDDDEQYNDISNLSNYKDVSNYINHDILSRLPQPSFSNITIDNASNVVLGNIIKIRGDLIINVKPDNDDDDRNNNVTRNTNKDGEPVKHNDQQDIKIRLARDAQQQPAKENENLRPKKSVYRPACLIVPRTSWLAMDPMNDYNYINEPVDCVIISHTATTSSTQQSRNIGIIRDIQTFHIETRGWDDIGYNFLIGCDGIVYEGRGWGVEGAHTFAYNNRSIGISFIGCFMRKLPTAQALRACQKLLQRGVEEKHLSANFKLLGHRQCTSTESPGTKLYEEIKTWENFYDKNYIDELNESESETE